VGTANTVAPAGDYYLKVKRVFDTDKEGNQKFTRNGDPMVSVLCEIDDAGEWLGTTLWHNVIFMNREADGTAKKGAGMALHFLKSIGEPWEGDFEYDTARWPGKRFKAKLKLTKDQFGQPKNEIHYLIDEETAATDEEVPF
jgi:hypothetical protein